MNKKEIQNTNFGIAVSKVESEIVSNERFNELKGKVSEAKKELGKLKISSREEMENGNELVARVKTFGKRLEDFRKIAKKPFLDGGKKVDEILKPILNDIVEITTNVSQKIIKFSEEEDKRIAEQQEKEEKKVDSGYQGEELAEKKVQDLENKKIEGKVAGDTGVKGSVVETVDFDVTDMSKIPDEFIVKSPNGQAIREFFRANKDGKIPGVKIVIRKTLRN